jgi:hypothetical protein
MEKVSGNELKKPPNRFFSPTKQMPILSFLSLVYKFHFLAISLT